MESYFLSLSLCVCVCVCVQELMADLRDTPHWIAGFVGSHSSVRDRDDLYDLLLDLDSTSVSVALHAQGM